MSIANGSSTSGKAAARRASAKSSGHETHDLRRTGDTGEEAVAVMTDTLKPLYDSLQRYAGWLDRERQSVAVRNDVLAIGIALETGVNPGTLLLTLDADLKRLPSSEVRKMLKAASARIHRVLAESQA